MSVSGFSGIIPGFVCVAWCDGTVLSSESGVVAECIIMRRVSSESECARVCRVGVALCVGLGIVLGVGSFSVSGVCSRCRVSTEPVSFSVSGVSFLVSGVI